MTTEEKQLLLIDLSARLPYGVKYCRESWNYEWEQEMSVVEVLEDIDKEGYINYRKVYKVWDIKPYLRPLSSMTKDEEETECYLRTYQARRYADFCNSKHLDYRGLIEKGLALEAPDGMYKLKQ